MEVKRTTEVTILFTTYEVTDAQGIKRPQYGRVVKINGETVYKDFALYGHYRTGGSPLDQFDMWLSAHKNNGPCGIHRTQKAHDNTIIEL